MSGSESAEARAFAEMYGSGEDLILETGPRSRRRSRASDVLSLMGFCKRTDLAAFDLMMNILE